MRTTISPLPVRALVAVSCALILLQQCAAEFVQTEVPAAQLAASVNSENLPGSCTTSDAAESCQASTEKDGENEDLLQRSVPTANQLPTADYTEAVRNSEERRSADDEVGGDFRNPYEERDEPGEEAGHFHNPYEEEGHEEGEEYEEEEEEYEEEEPPGAAFGAPQYIANEEVYERLMQTEEYMEEFTKTHDFYVHLRGECVNHEAECTQWAVAGGCEEDPDIMKQYCAPSCGLCTPPEGPGAKLGVPQKMEEEGVDAEAIWATLQEAEAYMHNVVWSDDDENHYMEKARPLCYNYEAECTVWAAQGDCTRPEEMSYMIENCSPVCGTCDELHYETRCPVDPKEFPDVWKPGDLNRMFERVVADAQYKTTVLSRPDYLPGHTAETADYQVGPWIITIDDFFSAEDAEHLIQWGGEMGYARSEEVGGIDEETGEALEAQVSEDRTSTNAWCSDECDNDEIVVKLFDRIHNMTGVPPHHSESLQLLKYEADQFYLTHNDYVPGSYREPGGPRILTIFIYLSDVEEGGETRFDWFDDMKVTPKLGRVAVWPSVLNDDPTAMEERTYHEAMPVLKGQKFAANAWLHLRDYEKAQMMGC